METGRGEFRQALALSALLLIITYLINLALTWIQQQGRKGEQQSTRGRQQ
jgi:ABC-type tungstate transport system substrate-binding protein